MQSNLILFVLVPYKILIHEDEHEDDDEGGGNCRAVDQNAKAAPLTSVF